MAALALSVTEAMASTAGRKRRGGGSTEAESHRQVSGSGQRARCCCRSCRRNDDTIHTYLKILWTSSQLAQKLSVDSWQESQLHRMMMSGEHVDAAHFENLYLVRARS